MELIHSVYAFSLVRSHSGANKKTFKYVFAEGGVQRIELIIFDLMSCQFYAGKCRLCNMAVEVHYVHIDSTLIYCKHTSLLFYFVWNYFIICTIFVDYLAFLSSAWMS